MCRRFDYIVLMEQLSVAESNCKYSCLHPIYLSDIKTSLHIPIALSHHRYQTKDYTSSNTQMDRGKQPRQQPATTTITLVLFPNFTFVCRIKMSNQRIMLFVVNMHKTYNTKFIFRKLLCMNYFSKQFTRGKSLLESWGSPFLPD